MNRIIRFFTKLANAETSLRILALGRGDRRIMQNEALLRMIQLAIPPEAMRKAIIESAKRLPNMDKGEIRQLELVLKSTSTFPEMLDHLTRLKLRKVFTTKRNQRFGLITHFLSFC